MDWYPLWNSLRIAAISCVLVFFSGIALAYYVARLPRVLKGLLDVVLTLPLVLPPTVCGWLLLLVFGLKHPVGIFLNDVGIRFVMTWYGGVLASAVVAFPLMYRTARGAFESFDETLAWSGKTLGLSDTFIFWHIRMPYCKQGIIAGTVLAFARALAPNPQVLLLDEPFAAIDAKVRQELRNWLKDTIHRVGITSIFVTHDQDEAVEVADEIIITNHGHIEQVGTPLDIYRQPRTPFVAQFIGTPVVINNCNILTGFLQVGAGKQAIVRPEFLKIYKHGTMKQYISAAEEGTVEAVVFRGSHLDVTVRIKGLAIHGEYSLDDPPLSVGETVQVLIYRLYVLDGDKTYLKENSAMTSADVFYI